MTPTIRQSLFDALNEFDWALPLEEASTLPSYWYYDSNIYEAEKELLLNTWQPIGRIEAIEYPYEYFTVDLLGEPIVALRNQDSEIRVLSNVCRHRGAQILSGCGSTCKLRCQYHGWTYDVDGKLKGTPEFDGVANFSRKDNGLPVLSHEEFFPLLMASLGKPKQSYADICKPLLDTEEWLTARDYDFHERLTYDIKCNWKVAIDNFLDGGYHVNTIHPGLASALDYKKYHSTLYSHSNVQIAPMKDNDDLRKGTAQYWWLFPNMMVNMYDRTMDMNIVIPTGKDTCRLYMDFYFNPDTTEEWRKDSIAYGDKVQLEDTAICEQVYQGLQSRTFNAGRFSVRREATGYQFHQLWAEALATLGSQKE
jgi:choline monooxygenase